MIRSSRKWGWIGKVRSLSKGMERRDMSLAPRYTNGWQGPGVAILDQIRGTAMSRKYSSIRQGEAAWRPEQAGALRKWACG